MKVLVCHNIYRTRAGEYQAVQNEIGLLREHGADVRTYSRDNRDIDAYGRRQRRQLALETVYSRRTARDLKEYVSEWKPDIVHVHNVHPLISPSIYYFCDRADIPVVQTLHNYRWFCVSGDFFRSGDICEDCRTKPGGRIHGIAHRCYRRSLAASLVLSATQTFHEGILRTYRRKIEAVIVLSDFAGRKLIESGYPPGMLYVKPNFVRVPESCPLSDDGTLLYVGRLTAAKGIRVLLRAAEQLPGRRFVVVGDGPMRDELTETVSARGLGNVELTGHVGHDACMEYIARCHALVFPSIWHEPMGLAILEAFARRKPVLASRLSAIPRLIGDDERGILFEPGDAESLVEAIHRLDANPAERAGMGQRALEYAKGVLSPEANWTQLMTIYRSALAKRGALV